MAISGPLVISRGRSEFLTLTKGPMSTDQARRKELVMQARDFERRCKVEGLLAIFRQIGLMQYGPATPTPDEDMVAIDKLSVFGKYKVLSGDQIKLRKARELSIDDLRAASDADGVSGAGPLGSRLDRHVHQQWLANTFD